MAEYIDINQQKLPKNASRLTHIIVKLFAVSICISLSACVTSAPIISAPESNKGPAILILSGSSGTALYRSFAKELSKMGYVAFLVEGKTVAATERNATENLNNLLADVQRDTRVIPGKVAIIGFSLGGGGALAHATSRPEIVSTVIVFYPSITDLDNIPIIAARVTVPTLILAGEQDSVSRCRIESIREFKANAQHAAASVTLVSYPYANHGFNLVEAPQYRSDDAANAWERTKLFLLKYHPLL